jgi:hypothetical protein
MRSANLPPLIAASPPGTPQASAGVLGAPATSVLFGGSPVNGALDAGGRITAGLGLGCDQACGFEAYYFQLASQSQHFQAGSPAILGRPFFNTQTGRPDAQLVSLPGIVDGNAQASASAGSLLGAGVLARVNLCCDCCCRLDAFAGYRYLSMSDQVRVNESLTSTDPAQVAAPLGTKTLVTDAFHTANLFNGGDVGLTAEWRWTSCFLRATGSLAVGSTYERADINGATSVMVPGFAPVSSPGGFLALSSNSGIHTRNVFAVVPELRFQLGCDITARTRIFVGYELLYWSRVIRAGDQIDLGVSPALLPPPLAGASPLRPAFHFQGTPFWAQGVNLGLEFRF